MNRKPEVGFWQLWNMCFGFVGIQFGFALQNSNVSRIFQTLGANVDDIPILWIAAPLTGLLVQPVIGHLSDRTWGRLGRRRPYFLVGAVLATLALIAMPNSPTLWVAAGMLWLLDASINVALGPFRAFIGDHLPATQRTAGYAMQTFFIGIASVVASVLPWLLAQLGVNNAAAAGQMPDTVKYAFYFGAAALLATLSWTVLTTREYSPQQLAAFADGGPTLAPSPCFAPPPGIRRAGVLWTFAGLLLLALLVMARLDRQLYLLALGAIAYGLIQLVVGFSRRRSMLVEIALDLHAMPPTMRQLALVQFFSWFALFGMWIYTTAAVTAVHFGASDTQSAAYNDGGNWVGVLFAAYNGFAALAVLLIPWLTRRLGLRLTHALNLLLGGLGLMSFLLIRDPHWLLLAMLGVGFAWASILSLPYALLSDSVPSAKMGVYMGLFNFFIVIPQILAASLLGFLLRQFFADAPINALLLSGASLVIAAVLTLRVKPA